MTDLSPIDKSNFRQFILQTPEQFEIGMSLAKNVKLGGRFSSVTVSGMGGSALPANLLRTYLGSLFKNHPDYKPFEIYINRYYSLPPEAESKSSLNFVASYSGNTEETLSSLNELKELGLPFVALSSGGKLEELSKEYGMPHMKLPIPFPNYQPRMTEEILASTRKFKEVMPEYEEKGKELSKKLSGKTPVIYASPKYKSTAMVWKIKFNENAKTPAFWNFFPELNHNEMVGFTNPQAKFFIIMLKDPDDNPMNLKRYDTTAKLLAEEGIESQVVDMKGEDVFSKMFLSISLADWTSYYLALKYNQDPTPVEMVEKLKKILA